MRLLMIAATGSLCLAISGCGGSSTPSGPPQFTIASANWVIPLTDTAFAGGLLSQSGNTISGVLHVSGLPCFDPVADALIVQGMVSSDPKAANALTFTTTPVRGQVLTVSATWDPNVDPAFPLTTPPNPVKFLAGTAQLTGPCAVVGGGRIQVPIFSGSWGGSLFGPNWSAGVGAVLSQTGPDAQGFSQLSGTFTIRGTAGSPCFTNGTITNTSFAGDIAQMNVLTDSSGELTGSARTSFILFGGVSIPALNLTFVGHGGNCDGQSITGRINLPL